MTKTDIQEQPVFDWMNACTLAINRKLEDSNHVIQAPASGLILDDDKLDKNNEPKAKPQPNQDDSTEEAYSAYLGAELFMPHGDT